MAAFLLAFGVGMATGSLFGQRSETVNIVKTTVNTHQKFITQILNSVQTDLAQTQNIRISNIVGDVNISGNTMTQTATVNLAAAFASAATVQAQQELVVATAQTAKAVTSGFSLNNSSASKNITENVSNALLEVTNNIQNKCYGAATQLQNIEVINVQGNVNLTNNSYGQIYTILTDCVAQTVTNSTSLQKAQTSVSQTASATTKGIELFGFMFMLIGVIAAISVLLIPAIMKFKNVIVFGIVLIVGCIIMSLYFTTSIKRISTNEFSRTVANTCPGAVVLSTAASYRDYIEAANACKALPGCAGFDFIGYTTDSTGSKLVSVNDPPITKFYSDIPSSCNGTFSTPDNIPIFFVPTFDSGPKDPIAPLTAPVYPTQQTPSVWLNTTSTEWFTYVMSSNTWKSHGKLATLHGITTPVTACWRFQPVANADIIVDTDKANPTEFRVTYKNNTLVLAGPGRVVFTPTVHNASGYIATLKFTCFLIVGGLIAGAGLIGLIISTLPTSAKPAADHEESPQESTDQQLEDGSPNPAAQTPNGAGVTGITPTNKPQPGKKSPVKSPKQSVLPHGGKMGKLGTLTQGSKMGKLGMLTQGSKMGKLGRGIKATR